MSGRMERWPWTPRKLERLRCLHAASCTGVEIAREFGCSRKKVARGLALLGLSFSEMPYRLPWPGARSLHEVWILDLLEEGPKSLQELTRALGFTFDDRRTSFVARRVARLRDRGLVVSLGRKAKRERSGPGPGPMAYALARRLRRREPVPEPEHSGVISD